MALFARICVLRGFPAAAYREVASPKTLVRPCSGQKLLIYELETHRAFFTIVDGHYINSGEYQKNGSKFSIKGGP